MSIASQIAYVLQDTCPGLSTEATAIALGLDLCPAPGARYCFWQDSSRVEYDSLLKPAEQERYIQRAIICRTLDDLSLQLPREVTIAALTYEVFTARAFGAALRRVVRQR